MFHSSLKQFALGVTAPFHSARFLLQKKSLFLIGLAPHILNFIFYFWIVSEIIIGRWLSPFLSSFAQHNNNSFLSIILKPQLVEIIIWIFAILLYGALGTAFVNAVASPVYDYIAKASYEGVSTNKIPQQTFADFIDSVISEVTKATFVFCVFIISLFFTFLAPFFFIFSVWYLGWNSIDRTLLLLNLPLRERVRFGIQNSALCIGLGVWSYIPLLGPLFAFTTASAGAILVAKSPIPYIDDITPGADF